MPYPGSPTQVAGQAAAGKQASTASPLINNKARHQRSQLLIGGLNQVGAPGPQAHDRSRIAQVKQNMMRPEAFKHRGNTGNTGYGFEQVQEAPADPYDAAGAQLGQYRSQQDHLDDDEEPNAYQFIAPGNKGSLVELRGGGKAGAVNTQPALRAPLAGPVKYSM